MLIGFALVYSSGTHFVELSCTLPPAVVAYFATLINCEIMYANSLPFLGFDSFRRVLVFRFEQVALAGSSYEESTMFLGTTQRFYAPRIVKFRLRALISAMINNCTVQVYVVSHINCS